MALSTCKVEFSKDDLSVSNAAATWTNISDYVISVDYSSGKASDLDSPQAGTATIILDNSQRFFEPDYTGSPYYPAVRPMRRFKITITADAVDYPQGIWFAESWDVDYAALPANATTTVSCVDGVGILSLDTLPVLAPPDAQTYADVLQSDNPVALFPLNEQSGATMTSLVGPGGSYKNGVVDHVQPNPVTGDSGYAARFGVSSDVAYGRSLLEDVNVFTDANQFTAECVATMPGVSPGGTLLVGPYRAANSTGIFQLENGRANAYVGTGAGAIIQSTPTDFSGGTHHHAMTWDGSTLTYYKDGVLVGSVTSNSNLISPDANDYLYVATSGHGESSTSDRTISFAAFYDYALPAARIAAHADAALNLGNPGQPTGTRVAALATNTLWSTAGITGGQLLNVAARMQTGQSKLSEIMLVAQAEQPFGLFYFDDSGNPAYQGADYTPTSAATFSDNGSDIEYTAFQIKQDDDLYNTITISREGGAAQTRTDAASVSEFFTRGYNQTGLIVESDADADLTAAGIADHFSQPLTRVESIDLDGVTANGRLQILSREIGDTIRVKIRTDTAEPVDVITRILGKRKTWTPDGNLTCTWNLSRGIDASQAVWYLGVTGYSELNSTTILA